VQLEVSKSHTNESSVSSNKIIAPKIVVSLN